MGFPQNVAVIGLEILRYSIDHLVPLRSSKRAFHSLERRGHSAVSQLGIEVVGEMEGDQFVVARGAIVDIAGRDVLALARPQGAADLRKVTPLVDAGADAGTDMDEARTALNCPK
jgi:hypothetical protein